MVLKLSFPLIQTFTVGTCNRRSKQENELYYSRISLVAVATCFRDVLYPNNLSVVKSFNRNIRNSPYGRAKEQSTGREEG